MNVVQFHLCIRALTSCAVRDIAYKFVSLFRKRAHLPVLQMWMNAPHHPVCMALAMTEDKNGHAAAMMAGWDLPAIQMWMNVHHPHV